MTDEQQEQTEPQTEVVDPRWLEEQEEAEKQREGAGSGDSPEQTAQPQSD